MSCGPRCWSLPILKTPTPSFKPSKHLIDVQRETDMLKRRSQEKRVIEPSSGFQNLASEKIAHSIYYK